MKIDRPGSAIIGAVLMVAFRIVGAGQAGTKLEPPPDSVVRRRDRIPQQVASNVPAVMLLRT
jgi:hypothetical protein